MHQDKYEAERKVKKLTKKNRVKAAAFVLMLVLLASAAVHGTVAYLFTATDPITNQFISTEVPNQILQTQVDGATCQVRVQNLGNVDAYVRATVVFNWVNDENGNVYGIAPVAGTEYSIDWTKAGWVQGADGYYYYTQRVASYEETGELFTNCKELTAPEGYSLRVRVLAQTIQADGKVDGVSVVTNIWGIAVNNDGTLNVTP